MDTERRTSLHMDMHGLHRVSVVLEPLCELCDCSGSQKHTSEMPADGSYGSLLVVYISVEMEAVSEIYTFLWVSVLVGLFQTHSM